MAQKSGLYVVYRVTLRDDKGETLKKYVSSFAECDDREGMRKGDNPTTETLAKARTFTRTDAFEKAIASGEGWSVGELVGDNRGVRVEE